MGVGEVNGERLRWKRDFGVVGLETVLVERLDVIRVGCRIATIRVPDHSPTDSSTGSRW